MKHGKKLLSLFLSVVMVLGLLPTSALAAGTGTLSDTVEQDDITAGTEYTVTAGTIFRGPSTDGSTQFSINSTVGDTSTYNTILNLAGDVSLQGYISTTIKNGTGNVQENVVTINGAGYTLKKIPYTQSGATNLSASWAFYPYVGTLNLNNITLAAVGDFTAGTDFSSSLGAFLLFGDNFPTSSTLNKVTFKDSYNYCIRWNKAKVTIKVQDTLTFSGSTAEEINLGIGTNTDVPFNFNAGSSVVCKDKSNNDSRVRIKLDTGLTADKAPFKFAEGDAITPAWANKFTCTNENHVVFYQGGALYIAHNQNNTYKNLKLSVSGAPTGNYTVNNNTQSNISYGGTISNITISPASGYKFSSTDASALSTLNTNLAEYGLSATFNNGNIEITGNLLGDVNLATITGWPTPVEDSKTVTLPALDNTGLTLTSGSLTQTVTGTSAITNIVLTADDSHILPNDYAATLNSGILSGTNLTATQNGQTITISGTPTAAVNKGGASWPETTAAEAVITDGSGTVVSKHTSLSAAANAVKSDETVTLIKVPNTTNNWHMKSNVTLVDLNGNSYKSADGEANTTTAGVHLTNEGKVTLLEGTLEVTPASSKTAEVKVEGKNDTGDYYTVSGIAPFTVTAGTGSGESGTKATVTIPTAGNSVSNGRGLTFTAGAGGNATFPLDGSDLTGAGSHTGDAITVGKTVTTDQTIKVGTKGEGEGSVDVNVVIPRSSDNKGDVTVTKGDGTNAMATVKVEKAGDKFTVGDKTYTAGTDGATFTIDANGNVKLTSGGLSLADGESTTGPASGKTIENPTGSGNDSVTVENKTTHDEVTVPKKGGEDAVAGSVKIGEGENAKTYLNTSTTADLKLKVTADGVSVISGSLTETIGDGSSTVGTTSGATIKNPEGSGNDTITVASDSTKDTVTVPKNGDGQTEAGSVTITKDNKSTTYTNGSDTTNLVIDVTANGASLSTGNVKLDENEGIGVNTNTITNTSTTPIIVKKADTGVAVIELSNGQSFTDEDGNKYTANGGDAAFEVDDAGNITLLAGSATVEPAEDKTPTVNVRKTPNSSDTYPVSGDKPFGIAVGNDEGAKATVTIPTKGNSVSVGDGVSFTAGADNATFPLNGYELTNDGDSATVKAGKSADIKVGTNTIKVPAGDTPNTGNTTVTKGQPTIVKLAKKNDTFKIGDQTYTADADNTEFVINSAGTATKIEAQLIGTDGKAKNFGSVEDMLGAAANGETVKISNSKVTAVTDKTLANGVTLEDIGTNNYIAQNGDATIDVDTDGKVTLKSGALRVEGGELKVGDYTVSSPSGSGNTSNFTVSDSGTAGSVPTVTIEDEDGNVSNGKGLTFTAGAANSTFPLDGSKLNNNGDSVTVSKDKSDAQTVALGSESGAPSVTIPASNTGNTTVTKGQPAGFVGSVTLTESGDTFTVGGKTYKFDDGGTAESSATFGIRADGSVAMLDGSTVLPASGGEVEVKADGWNSGVSVSTPSSGNTNPVLVTANSPDSAAVVKSGDSVTIGGKTYKALEDTNFNFDQNGNVTLAGGKTELDKDESILGGVGKVEIKNTSADAEKKITVESIVAPEADAKNIVTVPAGGKVTIGGKEYTNSGSDEMKLEIDAQGNVTLADGKADFSKDTSLTLNGAEIKNTGNSALTLTDNGDGTGKLDVKQNGSFTVGTGTVKDPSADMSFTINDDGTLTATLPENGSVTINGVKYTGGTGGATLKLDKDGNITSITGNYSATVPGSASYAISGIVKQEGGSGIEGATVKLTQGGKEVIRIAPVKTNSNGEFTFPAVPAGTYNVVVEKDGKTMTQLVTVTSTNVSLGELVLPTASVSSVVEVTPDAPVGAMVGRLNTEAEENHTPGTGETVKITLTVDAKDENHADIREIKNLTEAAGKNILPLDITLNKTVSGGSPTTITETNTVLEIILTFDTTNKTNITVFRKHGSDPAVALEKLTERPTNSAAYRDGTYYVGNGFVVVYTSKFSTYAIGYDVVSYSGGSGSSSASTSVNVGKTTNGSVSVSPKSTRKGNTVTVTVKPDAGFKLGSLTVTDKNGNALTVKKLSDTQYTFIAPAGKVDVKAVFVKAGVGYADCAKDSTCPVAAFTDTLSSAWYHDGVHYCVDNGLMSGYSNGTFAPDRATTRAQLVVMLWRLNGCPVVDSALDFTDVPADAWCAEAIRWAKATGVSGGYGNGTFGPDNTMTREQMVTFLYRYAQNMNYDVSVGESTNILSFADAFSVSEYAIPAMQWACGSGMMAGKRDTNGDMILMPQGTTTRAQMATMLMRFCAEIAK